MKYICYTFSMPEPEPVKDMLMSLLADSGFESFMDEDDCLNAYCPIAEYRPTEIDTILQMKQFANVATLKVEEIADQDWNATWEASYSPAIVSPRCRIRAPFHSDEGHYDYDLIINPKMSFGTAHHETTSQIICLMVDQNFKGLDVLDMGCGTAVLAILAKKLGANNVVAIDNDEWAYNNSIENIALNNENDIVVELGDAATIGNRMFDIVLANINRNILLRDMKLYVKSMKQNALIFFSGFYLDDLDMIKAEAKANGLEFVNNVVKNNWTAAVFVKK